MERLLDINFTLRGADRHGDRENVYILASEMGELAWASESQFYLLTEFDAFGAQYLLRQLMRPYDFLKTQEVCGQVCVSGLFPSAVNALFEIAHSKGIVELDFSVRSAPRLASMLPSPI
jgi:hypothetical protein